jgi:hypothetical protein
MDDLTDTRHISRLEIVDTGRRRRWSAVEKLRIVEESFSAPRLASAAAGRRSRFAARPSLAAIFFGAASRAEALRQFRKFTQAACLQQHRCLRSFFLRWLVVEPVEVIEPFEAIEQRSKQLRPLLAELKCCVV